MDESKEYIDMCKKLPENVKQDFENVYPIDDVGSVCVLDDGEIGYIGTHLGGWQCHGYECSGEDEPVTQLYTQDQLQDMVNFLSWEEFDAQCLRIARRHFIKTKIQSSKEQAGLMTVIMQNFNKEWNGEEWI